LRGLKPGEREEDEDETDEVEETERLALLYECFMLQHKGKCLGLRVSSDHGRDFENGCQPCVIV
jgi:hypothetical protein